MDQKRLGSNGTSHRIGINHFAGMHLHCRLEFFAANSVIPHDDEIQFYRAEHFLFSDRSQRANTGSSTGEG